MYKEKAVCQDGITEKRWRPSSIGQYGITEKDGFLHRWDKME